MGNTQSEFQEQFNQLYRFVGLVQDRIFKQAKIYRKIKFNFDYMMVVQRPVNDFVIDNSTQASAKILSQRLQIIRKYQNAFTARLSYSIILEGGGLKCRDKSVRLFMQYYNHSLSDYLSALRQSKLSLTLEQLKFVIASLVEGMTILRKMQITEYWLTVDNIWISVDQGTVVINPVYFIYESVMIHLRSQHMNQINKDYQPVDLSTSRSRFYTSNSMHEIDPLQFAQLQNLFQIYIQMTRYIHPKELREGNLVYQDLRGCKTIGDTLELLGSQCQQLNVEQFNEIKQPQALYTKRIQ